jgi:transcriptional regulator with XRE-family HTH domain
MPGSTPTLRDMVIQARRSLTLDQLAERAYDPESGETASRGLLYDLERGAVNRPPVGRLHAIAAALGKPYEVVRQAAIAQWLPAEDAHAEQSPAEREILEKVDRAAAELQELSRMLGGKPGPGESATERETA